MKYILGIDVGGTKIAAGLVDEKHQVSEVAIENTEQQDLLGQIQRIIQKYRNFKAIGIGMPGPVSEEGIVFNLPNVKKFKKINLKTFLNQEFDLPVHVLNDAKAFTLAEAIFGAGRNFNTVVGVVMGTGIGSGLVINKELYSENPFAGEIGHVKVGDTTLEQTMRLQGKDQTPKQRAELIGSILSLVIDSVHPDVIVFGGGRMDHPGMQVVLDKILVRDFSKRKIQLRVFQLKHAGIIGATLPLLKK